MMKKNILLLCLSSCLLFVAGCATKPLPVRYLVHPEQIVDINSIDIIKVNVSSTLEGNAFDGAIDTSFVNGLIENRISARITQEGYFKAVDSIWGDVDGVSELSKIVEAKNNAHGYSNFSTESDFPVAQLNIRLEANVNKSKSRDEVSFELITLPYSLDLSSKPPRSSPNYAAKQKRVVSYTGDIETIKGLANLYVEIIDKKGVKVYEKEFKDLKVVHSVGMHVQKSLPTGLNVVGEMIIPAIETVVKDISPHKELRKLFINEDGDERVVFLLQAQAFSEAIELLEDPELFEELELEDYENLALAYEIVGDLFAAKYNFECALKIDDESEISVAGIERINTLIESKKKLMEMFADSSKNSESKFKSDK